MVIEENQHVAIIWVREKKKEKSMSQKSLFKNKTIEI